MLRKSLAALVLAGLAAAPAHAQDVPTVWEGSRVDARPPAGILWGQLMPEGDLRIQYTLGRASYGDVRFGTQTVPFLDVLDVYAGSPLGRTEMSHRVSLEYGFLGSVTFAVTAAWLDNSRDLANEDFLVSNESSGLSDITAGALFRVYEGNGVSAHLNAAVEIPTGSIEKVGPDLTGNTRLLPYEMQMGSGSLTAVPGATAAIQNEHGTVGAQALAKIRVMDNGRDYRLGNEFHGNLWMAFYANDMISVSTGARVRTWGSIQGEDAAMDASLEPGQDPLLSSGTAVAIPAGVNLRIPQGFLAGTEVLFEFVFPAYQSYDSFEQQGDWGINFTASKNFRIGDIF
jgi:hypothetical protein